MNRRVKVAITAVAGLASASAVATAAGGGTSVTPVHGTIQLKVAGKISAKACPGSGGASLATAHFGGSMTSETKFAEGKLSLKVREIASPTDEAMVTATGSLKDRSSGKRKATVRVTGVDHGNDLDGILVLTGKRQTVIANISSRQNPDGTASGTFGTGDSSAQQPANSAVIVKGNCR